jgi:hypothetical protein
LDNVSPGRRVFDVKLQGRTVLKDFDVVKEAGGVGKAVVRDFKHVLAGEVLTLEFLPAAALAEAGEPAVGAMTPDTAPIVSGLELFREEPALTGLDKSGGR